MADDEHIDNLLETCIRRYLAANPDAADTAEGIAVWWMPPSVPHAAPEHVQRVLDRLVAAGELARVGLAGGTVLYRRRAPSGAAPPAEQD